MQKQNYLVHNITEGRYLFLSFLNDDDAKDWAENYQHDFGDVVKVYAVSILRKIELPETN